MRPFKIAFSGAHSTGKTTAANALTEGLARHGYKVERAEETARKCPFPINRGATPEAQRWIYEATLAAEREAEERAAQSGAEGVICDRTLLDSIVYAFFQSMSCNRFDKIFPEHREKWRWLYQCDQDFMDSHVFSYDVIWHTKPDGRPPAEDGVRDTDPDWHAQIAGMFVFFSERLGWHLNKWVFQNTDSYPSLLDVPYVNHYPGRNQALHLALTLITERKVPA
ncbi:MAG: ATP-binding protein [Deltaproteobacteria bacterium]|jgi:nicotinamide riboside kinase|nr:ATP-binding protein [Deltaproteobacteria bacterium]